MQPSAFADRITSVNERFKNLIRERDDKLAIVLLVIMSLLMIIANRLVYPLLETPNSRFEILISISLAGVVLAEMAALSIWTVLSSQRFLTRLLILLVSTIVLLAAWLFGYGSTLSANTGLDLSVTDVVWIVFSNLFRQEPLYYIGWIPLLFLALCAPLIVLRFFGSRVLARIDLPAPPTRQPVTISGLMLATGLVAFTTAALQLPALIGDQQANIWATSGAFAGVFFLIGLLFVLPAVLILFSNKRSFAFWSPVILLTSSVTAVGIVWFFIGFTNSKLVLRDEDWLVPIQFTSSAMLMVIIATGIMRLFGYRLTTSVRS